MNITVKSLEQVMIAFSLEDQSKLKIDLECNWGIWYTGRIYLKIFCSKSYWTSNILRNEELVPKAKWSPLCENWQVLIAFGSIIVDNLKTFLGF